MKNLLLFHLIVMIGLPSWSQKDSAKINRSLPDSGVLNMDAVYNRPFLSYGKMPVSLGGYLEANTSYFQTDGVTDGLSFQLPRLTIFMASGIQKRISFLTEIELEEGGREINIEFASMDVQFHPLLNFRGGIVMNPIGAFNQNHDGPKWEFISRPISATEIIPSTFSNVGFGFFGKYGFGNWVWGYEIYATNGLDDKIISNEKNRTWLGASKLNTERFEESFNGSPLLTAKTAFRHRKLGEIGFSWMGGVYNLFQEDGLTLDQKRRVDVFAVDFNLIVPVLKTYLRGEFVHAFIDVPLTYTQQYGNQQRGGFLDVVQPILSRKIFGWDQASLNLCLRAEYTDFNLGNFTQTGGNISDHVVALVPGISFRASAQTVFRANYRYHWQQDLLGNPAARTAGFQIGFSTYF